MTPSAQTENPFEQFVLAHVKFDSKGHANVTSLHGLSKLLRWFYKEIIVEELKQERTRLLSVESMKEEIILWYKQLVETKTHDMGKDTMVFKKNGDWIRTDEVYRLVMFLEGRVKTLRQSILSDMEKGEIMNTQSSSQGTVEHCEHGLPLFQTCTPCGRIMAGDLKILEREIAWARKQYKRKPLASGGKGK